MYFVLMGEWNPPEYDIHTRGRPFNLSKGKHVLKRVGSHRWDVNILGIFACNFSLFLKFLQGIHFRKSLTDSDRSDRV